jgi:hypothetical protein
MMTALHYSNQVQDTYPHLTQIFSVIRGVVYLGTPHRGSGVTSIAKVVASVADSPHLDLIRDLERDSQTLDRIGDNFCRILDKRTMAVWSFAEELAIPGIGKVCVLPMHGILSLTILNRSSAIIGESHGDHISMVKFSIKDDPGYKKVINPIEGLEDSRIQGV